MAAPLLLVLISAATIFCRLGSLPLIGADEPRYARIAQEMSTGHRWVTPTLEGRPWLEKPPLYYWMTIPVLRIAGPTEAAARIGPALCAVISALAIFWLGRRLWGTLEAFLGSAILLTSIGFAAFGRGASTDMPMTAFLTIALAILLARSVTDGVPGWLLAGGYAALGLSVLAKGPVSLVLFSGVAVLFWCFEPQVTLRRWHALAGAAIVLVVVLPWFWLVFRENGFSFIAVFFINHNLARFVSDLHHHSQPFFYYVPVLLGLTFPWTAWVVTLWPQQPGWWRRLARFPQTDPARYFLALWIIVPLLFFSISRSKLPGYIIPVIPPLALLLGGRAAAFVRSGPRRRDLAWSGLGLSAAVSVAVPLMFWKSYGGNWQAGTVIGGVTAAAALPIFGYAYAGRWRAAWVATAVQSILLIAAVTLVGFPALAPYESARDIAVDALAARQGDEPIVSYRYFDHSLHYYTGYCLADDLPDLEALTRFASFNASFLVVTEAARIEELRGLCGTGASVVSRKQKLCVVRITRSST